MEPKEKANQAWIQRGRDLRREQYTPLDELEFSDEEVFFAVRECKSFLELIDTIKPE